MQRSELKAKLADDGFRKQFLDARLVVVSDTMDQISEGRAAGQTAGRAAE